VRRIVRGISAIWVAATLCVSGWILSQEPFAAPVIDRTVTDIRLSLERAVAREATVEWLVPRLDQAITADDPDRVRLLLDLAAEHQRALPPALETSARALLARHDGTLAQIADCGACAVDITACRSLALISACALPFEMSPLGDLNALRRAGADWLNDADVDEVEVGLATLGLGATAATIVSGGTSATVKFGATMLRLARKMGALPTGLMRALRAAATAGDEGATLMRLVTDIGRVRDGTSTAETLTLLRLAETPDDLARLARLAEAAGPDTRKAVEVLGKARAFRLLTRVSDLAVAAIGLIALLSTQAGALLVALIRWVLRPLFAPPPPRRPVA
jgi:hypothetical protein